MYKLFGLYTQVSCVRFSCLEEMFTPRNFFRTDNFEGSHMAQSQELIGQSYPVILTKEKVICNEYIG